MPKRKDIKSVLLLGAGPIVIGQACEFDYSGTQACNALREEGVRVILVNSNPATIMTDPEVADVTYIEPVHWQTVAKIIERERPDAILPTMGGQTALNCALDLDREGVLAEFNVKMIGANRAAIDKAEDRGQFRKLMHEIGLKTPRSVLAHDYNQAKQAAEEMGFPLIVRPSFTMGGSGGGIAYDIDELQTICEHGFDLSPTHECLIDESIIGWKEYELEVVRDKNDNCIIICSIENIDPMGVHTGDSITVAPAQTLTDKEYQRMRSAAFKVLRAIGVETGGANVQFAVNPDGGEMVVIEMNPRVSRSSALASKATGFPIAKVAAKLALGYHLNELKNEITAGRTPASFEPSIDYVVVKMPRFHFEKFPGVNDILTTQMKSVGEAMGFGANFKAALQKTIRSLDLRFYGLESMPLPQCVDEHELISSKLKIPRADRLWWIATAFRNSFTIAEVSCLTKIDIWFLQHIYELICFEDSFKDINFMHLSESDWREIKQQGFADKYLSNMWGVPEIEVYQQRREQLVTPAYKCIDTCAAEFPTSTAYMYSTYWHDNESRPSANKKVIILGSGPNRIGQGIEFDYCCVHAAQALRECGYETIMINCNPETVSTDYDCSDRLYFEPLTMEDVLAIIHLEQPDGVIVQFGGQTPLSLAPKLAVAGVPILGTKPIEIIRAEDRYQFQKLISDLQLKQPAIGVIHNVEEGIALADSLSYPILVRPSHVIGGRAMEILHSPQHFVSYLQRSNGIMPDSPLLIDRFLDNAIEVDVDAVSDGVDVKIVGIMEHIEQAGVHSGDSACTLPAHSLSKELQLELCRQVKMLAQALRVVGLINTQFAIQGKDVFVIEVNPRASRTVPFVAKATGLQVAKIAVRCMLGQRLAQQNIPRMLDCWEGSQVMAVKQPVFPFVKFPEVDPILGPEMRSTGEAMGIAQNFGAAYFKGQVAVGRKLPVSGAAFLSVRDEDKPYIAAVARLLIELGFTLLATAGTAAVLEKVDIYCTVVHKVSEAGNNIMDKIKHAQVQFILNTPSTHTEHADAHKIRRSFPMRRSAITHEVWYTTTLAGAMAAVAAMRQGQALSVCSIQELHANILSFDKPKLPV